MKNSKLLALLISAFLIVAFPACSSDDADQQEIENPGDDNNGGDGTEEPGDEDENGNGGDGDENGDEGEDEEGERDPADDSDFQANPQDINVDNGIYITLSASGNTIVNQFEQDGVTITDNGGHIIIDSTRDDELNYVLTGTIENGSVKIYGQKKFGLYLNGVNITNPVGPAINIQCSKKISVELVEGTQNLLIDGPDYVIPDDERMNGAFYSEGQLVFAGTGTLIVRGKYSHGIYSRDYIRIENGTINVREAVKDAIHPRDYFEMTGGAIKTTSEGEGVDSDGDVTITGGTIDILTTGEKAHGIKSGGDTEVNTTGAIKIKVTGNASKGFKPSGDMTIRRGTLDLTTTGSAFWDESDNDLSSCAAIKCDGNLVIEGGTIKINSSGAGGKGINVDGTIVVNGGDINIVTTGDQFVDRQHNDDTAAKALRGKGDVTINGGNIVISTSMTEAEGIESKAALYINGGTIQVEAYDDCLNAGTHIEITGGNIYCKSESNDGLDSNGTLTISGGVLVSAGTSAPECGIDCDNSTFTVTGGTFIGIGGSTSVPTASVSTQPSVVYGRVASSAHIVRVESTSGDEVITFQLPKTYSQNYTMLFSSPSLRSGNNYVIKTGGTITGGSDFHGLYTGATYSGGTQVETFSTDGMVTTINFSGGPGGGGRP